MVGSRTVTAVAGLVVSIAVTAAVWYYTGNAFGFLFVPFVPFLLGGGGLFADDAGDRPPVRECPVCGYRTRDPEFEHCPRDGTRLEVPRD